MTGTRLATIKDVAERLSVSVRTVQKLPIPHTDGVYRWSAVRKYLRANRSTPARDQRQRAQRVYVIRAKTIGLLKIGVSINPEKRMAALAEQAPDDLELVCSFKGNRTTEALLHRRFQAHRARGEWFHPHPEILAWLESPSV